ncbi:MAG: cyclase family protein [Actinobacteria bacterium]|nr:cyclase family protein [Actinomycetota bacterium]
MSVPTTPGEQFTRTHQRALLRERNNWGRWGAADQRGALNLVTPAKRVEAASLVRSGEVFSLSRPFPKQPGPTNPKPANHYVMTEARGDGGMASDFYGVNYHGLACTHMDALSHAWGPEGMWNGRSPAESVLPTGALWGGIAQWSDGILTRGVLLDVPRHRGEPYVTQDRPVHGDELAAICARQGIEVRPGDAVVVYSGREEWDRHEAAWGTGTSRPGLHASCLEFLRETDCAVLVWDMLDMLPTGLDVAWAVHAAIYAFGVALIDNAVLEPLAVACAAQGRTDFMLVASPLPVEGGTGSPVNPLVVL